jgi:hypothetical protein
MLQGGRRSARSSAQKTHITGHDSSLHAARMGGDGERGDGDRVQKKVMTVRWRLVAGTSVDHGPLTPLAALHLCV